MRNLKTSKTIKIDKEAVIKIEMDKRSNETNITVASGYQKGSNFVVVENTKQYKIEDASSELLEVEYFAEVDEQNSPSLIIYGLLYRAKQEGVFVLYSALDPEESLSVDVTDTTITVNLKPLVTTNQEIIDVISINTEVIQLIYVPKAIDLSADVDAPENTQEIK